jgi:hypothetical protein
VVFLGPSFPIHLSLIILPNRRYTWYNLDVESYNSPPQPVPSLSSPNSIVSYHTKIVSVVHTASLNRSNISSVPILAAEVTVRVCIRKVPGSNVGHTTDNHVWVYPWFCSVCSDEDLLNWGETESTWYASH